MVNLLHRTANALSALTDTALPCTCALCGTSGKAVICAECKRDYLNQPETRCRVCALPLLHADQRCGECLQHPRAFDRTIAACNYVAPLDQSVLSLKFGHQLALAPVFAEAMRDAILRESEPQLPSMLTVVPLGKNRLRERGFNQAAEIAKPLAKQLGIQLELGLLMRTRDTAQQSSLHPDDRHKNMRKAFALSEDVFNSLEGQHVGVIDDVMTTGTTLNEIAKLLKLHGASSVTNYVFARTIPH
jgi:ComF family protein